jgi:hypothetical protein
MRCGAGGVVGWLITGFDLDNYSWQYDHAMTQLNQTDIVRALEDLSNRLGKKGVRGEICLFGGTAMILAFQARQSTRDIDAVFAPTSVIRDLVAEIGREQGYADGWFNDGVKGFLSSQHDVTAANLPQFEHLQVVMPVPEYLFAMKCMAARVGMGDQDGADCSFLAKHLGLNTAKDAFWLVEKYYPVGQIQPRTQYFIESMFEKLSGDKT